MFENLPEEVLYHIRGYAMPTHPCLRQIKMYPRPNRRILYGMLVYSSEEHYWRDFEFDKSNSSDYWWIYIDDDDNLRNNPIYIRYKERFKPSGTHWTDAVRS